MSTIDDAESRSGLVILLTATFVSISTVVFGLRLYTRCILLRTPGADDWTMLMAQLMAITSSIATCFEAEAKYGLGRHIQTLTQDNIYMSFICLYITVFTYNLGLSIVKCSFLLQYRRIFPNTILRTICRWGLIIIPIWTVIQQVILGVSCAPLELIVPSAEAWCLETLSIWMLTSIISLITDFTIFLIPIPLIWDLQIPLRQKLFFFGVFGLGLFVCTIAIIRVPTLRAASGATDPTYDNIAASLWTVAEINAAIVCSSLPILRPLFFKLSSNLSTITRKTITRPTTTPADFPSNHIGHQLEDMPSYKGTINGQASRKGANDSSDDLVSATYDEMIYGRGMSRHSTINGGGRHQQSFQANTHSGGDISVELGIPKRG